MRLHDSLPLALLCTASVMTLFMLPLGLRSAEEAPDHSNQELDRLSYANIVLLRRGREKERAKHIPPTFFPGARHAAGFQGNFAPLCFALIRRQNDHLQGFQRALRQIKSPSTLAVHE